MLAVDTNIIVRRLTDDDPDQDFIKLAGGLDAVPARQP